MTHIAPGALVQAGSFGHNVWTVRCRAGKHGYWHLVARIADKPVPITKIARTNELRVIAPPPTFKNGEVIRFQSRSATIVEDRGDEVTLVTGLSRVDVSKADIVLDRISETRKEKIDA